MLAPPSLRPDWTTEGERQLDWLSSLPVCSEPYLFPAARRASESEGLSVGWEVATWACDGATAGSVPARSGAGLPAAPRPPVGVQCRPTRSACKCETPSKVCASPAAPCPRDPRPGKSDRQTHTPGRRGW